MLISYIPAAATTLCLWGILVHLVCDLALQNAWMAVNKVRLTHPAAWVHAGIHLAGLLLVFPVLPAVLLAISHLLIDTRVPLIWWRRVYKQSEVAPASHAALHAFAFSQDQAAHVLCIGLAALFVALR